MRREFIEAIEAHQATFGLDVPSEKVERLADHFELVQEHNALLHLVAPCSPEEFAVRHVLESLTLLEFLPTSAKFADVGPGGGFPSIPCLIVRDDLRSILIESKIKKARFLNEALVSFGLADRATVVNKQFEEADPGNSDAVTCRALDKFQQKLRRLLRWSGGCTLVLFGGNALAEALTKEGRKFESRFLPLSEQRFIFILDLAE